MGNNEKEQSEIEFKPISGEELEHELDVIFNYVNKKFKELRKRQYQDVEVYNKYVGLVRVLAIFEANYDAFKKEKEGKKESDNNDNGKN